MVHLRDGESSHPSKDHKCYGVEPRPYIGEAPEAQAKLDALNDIIEKEQVSNFGNKSIEPISNAWGYFSDKSRWNGKRHVGNCGKGIRISICLLESDHDKGIKPDEGDDEQDGEEGVGDHGYEGVVAEGDQEDQNRPKHSS